ncbi:Zinc finger protein 865 [Labeo rohita]|uniref:Zinc finger protein 865 n=1 Tax=Labeo rohita TaxID=84645 RepID=A0ABQ8LB56_LABRO|nr:Zinc finger protein 865 [Labeo rohita]
MQSYSKYEHIFKNKSNTTASAKQRQLAWENIAAQCSFSFDISSANRKKAEADKTGGGPAPPPLTNAEEMALSLNTGRPVAEGIPAGCSSEPVTPQDTSAYIKYSDGNICLLEPPALTEPQAVDIGDDDTISADTERPIESVEEQEEEEEGPSTSSAQMKTVQ